LSGYLAGFRVCARTFICLHEICSIMRLRSWGKFFYLSWKNGEIWKRKTERFEYEYFVALNFILKARALVRRM
jgi:hypothetical protein